MKNNKLEITKRKAILKNKKIQKRIKEKGISNLYIKDKKEIVNLINSLINLNNNSILVVLKLNQIPKMIFDIPNEFLSNNIFKIERYFKNVNEDNSDYDIFLATNDLDIFKRSNELIKKGIVKDTVFYEEKDRNIYIFSRIGR